MDHQMVQANAFLMGKSNLLIEAELKPCQNVTVHKLFIVFIYPL